MSSYIQILFGYRKTPDPIQFVSPKNNYENKLFDRVGYMKNVDDPKVKNNILNSIKGREDLQKYILANSDVGNELQENINAITSGDEKFNNAVLRRSLDLKNNDVFRNPQPITLLFNDVERFHQQNPIIGKIATQISVPKLSDRDKVRRTLLKGDVDQLENRLYNLRNNNNNDNNINNNISGGNNNNNGGKDSDDDSDDDDDDNSGGPPPDKSSFSLPALRQKIAEMDPSYKKNQKELKKIFRILLKN